MSGVGPVWSVESRGGGGWDKFLNVSGGGNPRAGLDWGGSKVRGKCVQNEGRV